MRLFNLIGVVILLFGCATPYKQPTSDSAAQLTIIHKSQSFPSSTRANAFGNAECVLEDGYGRLAKLGKAYDLSEDPVKVLIRPNERIYIAFRGWTQSNSGGSTYTDYTCINLVSFVPSENKSYVGYQNVSAGNRCKSYIVEENSTQVDSTFTAHRTPQSCDEDSMF